jgi:hypothetical protein
MSTPFTGACTRCAPEQQSAGLLLSWLPPLNRNNKRPEIKQTQCFTLNHPDLQAGIQMYMYAIQEVIAAWH